MQDSLLDDPTTRSPLEHSHGLYIVDKPAFGGAACFSWFEDDAAGLDYLRWRLVGLYSARLGLTYDEAEKSCRLGVHQALNGVVTLAGVDLHALNESLAELCEVRWAGSLDDLRLGNRPFEREVQSDFHDNVFGDERGFGPTDLYDWAHHATHYNG